MTKKQQNPNLGYIPCECGELAALRKDKNGKFYYDCLDCRRYAMTGAPAQERIMERAVVFGDKLPPGTPRWIAEQWSWGRAVNDRVAARTPIGQIDLPESPPIAAPPAPPGPAPQPAPPAPDKPKKKSVLDGIV